jgi:signal transduction histidine kinase
MTTSPDTEPRPQDIEKHYDLHRRRVLVEEIWRVVLAVLVLTLLFDLILFVVDPVGFLNKWPSYVLLLVAPLLGLSSRLPALRNYPATCALLADFVYTLAIVGRLVTQPQLTTVTALFISAKLLGTAILIPWPTRFQILSAVSTVALYWLAYFATGQTTYTFAIHPHELAGPLFAAVLSIVGARRADRLRYALFVQSLQLQREVQVSSHYAATMTHELRNLLTAVDGYGQILQESESDADSASAIAKRLRSIARQGLDIIRVTLALSRAQGDTIQVDLEPASLSQLFDDLAGEFPTKKQNVSLVWNADGDLPEVVTDVFKLKMILRNLIANAIKFTDRGQVKVEARRHGSGVRIEVTDTGPGIQAEQLEHIFKPFHQADRSREGAGLGLYVVTKLSEALGGEVGVDSVPGSGSTFRIWLPIRPQVKP